MPPMSELIVTIPPVPGGGYKIHIESGSLSALWLGIEDQFPKHRKFVVTDANLVAAGHLEALIGTIEVPTYIIDPPGEVSKHINTAVSIIEAMESAFFGRDSVIIALGGGTVGDIAGFAAAIFKRGIKVLHIPTTTVAQADSSVGGKTGVDSSVSKNAFGAFWHPSAVFIDPATLTTLDDDQYRSGLAESVKHALIADSEYFDYIEANVAGLLNRDMDVLEKMAYSNCRIKAAVVAEDPTEQNKRRILNYGHTLGHAVESASNYKLLHGEAVAIGIIAAGLIEQELGLGGPERLDRTKKVLNALSMPLEIPKAIKKKDLLEIIKYDKKAVNQWPRFVLLEGIGSALCRDGQWAHEVSRDVIEKTIDRLYP